MWDGIQVLNKGTEDVKQSKIKTLMEEYELFCIESGETMASM